jgi:hypothetical protein
MARKGFPSTLGAMGDPDLRATQFDPERTYLRESPYGSMDPNERLALLDAENIYIAILSTTVGLLWAPRVQASDGVRHQFTTLFDFGVFDQFPRLKVLVLESGGGWIGYWLDRIDAVYGHTFIGHRVPLEHKPSDYFRERSGSAATPTSGRSRRWPIGSAPSASCGRRTSHTPITRRSTSTTSMSSRPAHDRAKFLGDNARHLFDLPAGRP